MQLRFWPVSFGMKTKSAQRKPYLSLLLTSSGLLLVLLVTTGAGQIKRGLSATASTGSPAPEFTHAAAAEWINSEPLSLKSLQGQVVLIDFWTFECWNCYRSFPWLNALEEKFHDRGLQVIGIHTPEFEHEKERDRIVAKVAEFGLKHPIMIDNDFSYWRAMNNRFWPAFYLLDKQGKLRGHFVGETHVGDQQAQQIEAQIAELLAE